MTKHEQNESILNFLRSIQNGLYFNMSKCKCEICEKQCLDLNNVAFKAANISVTDDKSIDKLCNNITDILEDNNFVINNNKLYCKECYEQFKNLNSISKNVLRPSKVEYYLNIAREVSTRSTCLRRRYGAIIVKNDSIISTGYNGSPRCTKNCIDLGECRREKLNIPRGQNYEMCRAIHAEQNCIINASREQMIDSDLYLYGSEINGNMINNMEPCQICKKLIINSGIKNVICSNYEKKHIIYNVSDWITNDETLTDKYGY